MRTKVRATIATLKFLIIKFGCLWQRLLSSPLERGAGGVLWQTYTPLYRSTERSRRSPLFLEGNQKSLKFLYIQLGCQRQRLISSGSFQPPPFKEPVCVVHSKKKTFN